jgi:hypothetical protein
VIEDTAEARVERATAALFELVRRGREIVGAKHLGHAAERPERVLDPRDERLVRLAESEIDPSPAAEREHELEEQVPQGLAENRHAKIGRVREVDRGLATGDVLLLEVDFLLRPVHGAPVAHPSLKRAKLARRELSGRSLLEHVEDRGRLKHAVRVGAK